MEPEGSLPYSQVPATCPYPEPIPSSPHDPLYQTDSQGDRKVIAFEESRFLFAGILYGEALV
jgi:hypothetical protein